MTLIPPQYLNAVVSIEAPSKNGKEKNNQTIATGFLYGKFLKIVRKTNEKTYQVFLVTNRHVFEADDGKLVQQILLRFNMSSKNETKCFPVMLLENNKPLWVRHKNKLVDLAIVQLNARKMREEGIEFYFFQDDNDVYFAKDFESKGITTGDGVFILGFPLGIRGQARNYAIVKSGIIARADAELLKNKHFYLDAATYPGNSGGPVIYKPEMISIEGTKAVGKSGLLGVISAGITYNEVAVSSKTKRPRIVFEEQTGLVKTVPIDLVKQAIDSHIRKQKKEQDVTARAITN